MQLRAQKRTQEACVWRWGRCICVPAVKDYGRTMDRLGKHRVESWKPSGNVPSVNGGLHRFRRPSACRSTCRAGPVCLGWHGLGAHSRPSASHPRHRALAFIGLGAGRHTIPYRPSRSSALRASLPWGGGYALVKRALLGHLSSLGSAGLLGLLASEPEVLSHRQPKKRIRAIGVLHGQSKPTWVKCRRPHPRRYHVMDQLPLSPARPPFAFSFRYPVSAACPVLSVS